MRRLSPSFDESVSAYREMTALSAEGAATRARVLCAPNARRGAAAWRGES